MNSEDAKFIANGFAAAEKEKVIHDVAIALSILKSINDNIDMDKEARLFMETYMDARQAAYHHWSGVMGNHRVGP